MSFRIPLPVLRYRLLLVVFLHVLFAAGSLTLSFLARFDFSLGSELYRGYFWHSLPIHIAVFLGVSAAFGLFQGIWRYVSVDDLSDIVKASAVASLLFLLLMVLMEYLKHY